MLLSTFLLVILSLAVSAQGPPAKLKVGDKAPEFSLPNGDGKMVMLTEYTARTPVVIVFYRGFWWSSCTMQLTRLAEDYNKIKEAGFNPTTWSDGIEKIFQQSQGQLIWYKAIG